MAKKINNKFSLRVPNGLAKDIEKYINEFNYSSPAELFRESVREKIYGKNREEELENSNLKLSKEEEKFLFEQNKDLYQKLKSIEENM